MPKESDSDYYARRAREERLVAARATHECARQSHVQLAGEYEKLAKHGYFPILLGT